MWCFYGRSLTLIRLLSGFMRQSSTVHEAMASDGYLQPIWVKVMPCSGGQISVFGPPLTRRDDCACSSPASAHIVVARRSHDQCARAVPAFSRPAPLKRFSHGDDTSALAHNGERGVFRVTGANTARLHAGRACSHQVPAPAGRQAIRRGGSDRYDGRTGSTPQRYTFASQPRFAIAARGAASLSVLSLDV